MAAPTLVDNCMANWLILAFWADRLMFTQSPGLLSQHLKELYSHQLPVLLPPSLDHLLHPVPSRLPTPGQQKWDHPKAQDKAPVRDSRAGEVLEASCTPFPPAHPPPCHYYTGKTEALKGRDLLGAPTSFLPHTWGMPGPEVPSTAGRYCREP